jgi:mRNA interferase HigB
MHIISRKRLKDFWEVHPQAESPLSAWYQAAKAATWKSFDDVRETFRSADQVGDAIVFNIGGNKYRLIVKAEYKFGRLYLREVLTHADYSKLNLKG